MTTKTDTQAQPQAILSSAELGPKPAAWRFQQATYGVGDVRGRGWLPELRFTKPGWECMQKDVEPLYDQAALDAAVAAEHGRWREWLTEKASNKRKCYTQTQDADQLAAAEALDWAVRELAPNSN